MILKVKKEYLNAEVHYGANNTSHKVELANATQDQLKHLKDSSEKGEFDYLFEKETKEK